MPLLFVHFSVARSMHARRAMKRRSGFVAIVVSIFTIAVGASGCGAKSGLLDDDGVGARAPSPANDAGGGSRTDSGQIQILAVDAAVADAAVDAFVQGDGGACRSDDDCNDDVSCTRDRCAGGRCLAEPDDSRCPAHQACTPQVGCEGHAWAFSWNDVWDVHLPSGFATTLGTCGAGYNDVAVDGNGRLYGYGPDFSFVDSLVEITPVLGGEWTQGATYFVPQHYVGLEFSASGVLYGAATRTVYEVDWTVHDSKPRATFPDGVRASGDLAFVGTRFFATGLPEDPADRLGDRLVEFDLETGSASIIGPTGLACILGLAGLNGSLYGFTCNGDVVTLDLVTGRAKKIVRIMEKQIGAPFSGATTAP
jgi:hypothetical protein